MGQGWRFVLPSFSVGQGWRFVLPSFSVGQGWRFVLPSFSGIYFTDIKVKSFFQKSEPVEESGLQK
jgi:hypothetical protein